MTTKAGLLEIDVTSNTSSVEFAFSRLATMITDRAAQMERAVSGVSTGVTSLTSVVETRAKAMQTAMNNVSTAFKTVAGFTIAGIGANFFVDMIKGAIDLQAQMQDLAEKVGTTASKISMLYPAAKMSGTSMDEIANISVKFSKTLAEAQSGTGKAAAAMQAFGFNARDTARFLNDPVQGIIEMSRAFQKFDQDGHLAAARLEIMGKSANQLAPFFNQHAQQVELYGFVSDESAAKAKELQDQLVMIQLTSQAVSNEFASALVPWLNRLAMEFLTARQAGFSFAASLKFVAPDQEELPKYITKTRGQLRELRDHLADLTEKQKMPKLLVGPWVAEDVKKTEEEIKKLERAVGAYTKIRDRLIFMDLAESTDKYYANTNKPNYYGDARDQRLGGAAASRSPFHPASINSDFENQQKITDALEAMVIAQQKAASSQLQLGKADQVWLELQDKKYAHLTAQQKALASLALSYAAFADVVDKQNKMTKDVPEIAAAQRAFLQAIEDGRAQIARAESEAAGKLQAEMFSQQAADLKSDYDQGVVDFRTYFEQRSSIQRAALDAEKQRAQESVADALRLEQRAREALADVQPGNLKYRVTDVGGARQDEKAYRNDLAAAEKNLADATAKRITVQGDVNVLTAKGAAIGHDYVEQLVAANNNVLQSNRALDDAIERQQIENASIGMTTEQVFNLRIARVEELRDLEYLAGPVSDKVLAFYDGQIDRLQKLRDVTVRGESSRAMLGAWQDMFRNVADAGAAFIEDFARHGSSAFKHLWDNFKSWALSTFAKIAAQQLVISVAGAFGMGGVAAQALGYGGGAGGSPIGTLLGLSSTASSAGNLFSTGGLLGTGGTISGIANSFAGGFAGASVDLLAGAGIGGGIEVGGGIMAGLSAGLAAIPVAGWIALGALVIAGIVGGLDKGPAERSATFGSGPNSYSYGGGDAHGGTSAFGSFGIIAGSDKWFSEADQGKAITDFLAGIKGIDNAIAGLLDPKTVNKVKSNLAAVQTAFEAGTEHQPTSFGEILQRRYSTVAHAIDEELGTLVDAFTGTGEELGKFVVGVVGVHAALSKINTSALFGQNVTTTDVVNLTAAGDDVAATFQNLVGVFAATNTIAMLMGHDINQAFGAIGLASREARQGLIDAMGGLQSAGQEISYFLEHFYTSAERGAMAQSVALGQVNSAFAQFNLSAPTTSEAFRQMVMGIDLTTEAGRDMFAALIAVAPQIVTLYGDIKGVGEAADTTSKDLTKLKDSIASLNESLFTKQQKIANAQGAYGVDAAGLMTSGYTAGLGPWASLLPKWEQGHQGDFASLINSPQFLTLPKQVQDIILDAAHQYVIAFGTADEAAQQFADTVTNFADKVQGLNSSLLTAAQQRVGAMATLNSVGTELSAAGIAMPTSHSGWYALLNDESLPQSIRNVILRGAEAYIALNGSAEDAAQALQDLANRAESMYVSHLSPEAQQAYYGGQISTFNSANASAYAQFGFDAPTTVDAVLAIYRATRTMGEAAMQFGDIVITTLMPSLDGIAHSAGSATNASDSLSAALERQAAEAQAAAQAIGNTFSQTISMIQGFADRTPGDLGARLSAKLAMIGQGSQYTWTPEGGSYQAGTGQIGFYEQLAEQLRTANGGLGQYTPQYAEVRGILDQLIAAQRSAVHDLTLFTQLKADYGADKAEKLVALQNEFDAAKVVLSGNASAMLALQLDYDHRWADIINGTADGTDKTLDELDRLRQGILDYVNKLRLGNLSPMSPQEKFHLAAEGYNSLYRRALGGDNEALGKITDATDAYLNAAKEIYASSDAYVALFDVLTAQLEGLGLNQTPLVSSAELAIVEALPANSTLVSTADLAMEMAGLRSEFVDMKEQQADYLTALLVSSRQTTSAVKEEKAEPVAAMR